MMTKFNFKNNNMFRLIKNPDGLRSGNLIFVDAMVFPPNFMLAEPAKLEGEWEPHFNKATDNCAFLNAEEKWIKLLLQEGENGVFLKGDFTAVKVQDGEFRKFPVWEVKFKGKMANISFIHELQNYYKDWVGDDLDYYKSNIV